MLIEILGFILLSYGVIVKIVEYCRSCFERKDKIPYQAHRLLHEAFDFQSSGTGLWLKSDEPVQDCRHLIRDTVDKQVWKAASIDIHDLYFHNDYTDPMIVAWSCPKSFCETGLLAGGHVINLSHKGHIKRPTQDRNFNIFYDRNKSVYEYKKTVGPLVALFYHKRLPRVLCHSIMKFLC